MLLPGAQSLDQRGFVELPKDSGLTEEAPQAIAERRLMAKRAHADVTVGHAVGNSSRQVLLDGDLCRCRSIGGDINEPSLTPVNDAGDLEIADECPNPQWDDIVNASCMLAGDTRSGIFSVNSPRPRQSTAQRRGDLSGYGHCPGLAGSHITMAAVMVLYAAASPALPLGWIQGSYMKRR